jgi:hypothetical protein
MLAFRCLTVLSIVLLAGCGKRSDLPLAFVAGTVTCHGKPLDHGQVVFTPQGGTRGPQAVGRIIADGSFRMETAGCVGAAIGKHLVTVHCRRQVTPQERARLVIGESLVPNKYWKENESTLRFEVKEGKNDYRLVLE